MGAEMEKRGLKMGKSKSNSLSQKERKTAALEGLKAAFRYL